MPLTAGLIDRLRSRVPTPAAAYLPAPRRRRHIRARLDQNRIHGLSHLTRRGDPFECGTLWLAVEHLFATGQEQRLADLAPLANRGSDFERAVFNALRTWVDGDADAALRSLHAIGCGDDFDPFERMGARGWAVFLEMPRMETATAGPDATAPVFQFWDSEHPPEDVARVMADWQSLCGARYLRFDDASAEQFLRDEFGAETADRFRNARHPAIRSYYFRLGFLAARGGVYVDADSAMQPQARSFLAALSGRLALAFSSWRGGLHVQNGVLSAPAHEPLLERSFVEAGHRLDAGGRPVQSLAGGHMLTDMAVGMARDGLLGRAVTLLSQQVRDFFARTAPAAYKTDHRNWRLWDAAQA